MNLEKEILNLSGITLEVSLSKRHIQLRSSSIAKMKPCNDPRLAEALMYVRALSRPLSASISHSYKKANNLSSNDKSVDVCQRNVSRTIAAHSTALFNFFYADSEEYFIRDNLPWITKTMRNRTALKHLIRPAIVLLSSVIYQSTGTWVQQLCSPLLEVLVAAAAEFTNDEDMTPSALSDRWKNSRAITEWVHNATGLTRGEWPVITDRYQNGLSADTYHFLSVVLPVVENGEQGSVPAGSFVKTKWGLMYTPVSLNVDDSEEISGLEDALPVINLKQE